MGISDSVVQKTVRGLQESFLGQTDTVQYAISGFGRHPIVLAGGLLGALFGKARYFAVTDRATYLIAGGKGIKNVSPEHVIGTYPRDLDLSGFTGLYPKLEFPDGEKIYIPKPYDKPLRELFAPAV
jgi:hypothetical protein